MNINCIYKKLLSDMIYRVFFILYILIWQAGIISSTCFYDPGVPEPNNSLSADTRLIEATILISSDAIPPLQTETQKINSLSAYSYNSAADFSFSSVHSFKQSFLSYIVNKDDVVKSFILASTFISRGPPQIT